MNELRRTAYLEAMGVDSYVSRRQLPGAAPTRRLIIVNRAGGAPEPTIGALARMKEQLDTTRRHREQPGDTGSVKRPSASAGQATPAAPGLPRFSLSAIVAGRWLWLEELDDMPLAVEQVQLIEAMAVALCGATGEGAAAPVKKPEVALFDWPIHTNRQLDLGEEAARAAVAGFVGRRLEQYRCAGLVLLGPSCAGRVPVEAIGVRAVRTHSSREILASPALKQQVWRDLLPLVKGA
jgi:hypothetical protein